MAPLFGGRSVAYLERYLRREETLVATARPHRDIDSSFRTPRGGSELKRSPDRHARAMLPIPDRPRPGLTTYDAKDPDTSFPPIEPLLPPDGAPNVLIVLLDDVGFGASSAFGGPCATPAADSLAAGGLKYNRFHTDGTVRADSRCTAVRSEPPFGGHGQRHEHRHVGARQLFAAPEHQGAVADDFEVERVLDRSVRQVPRGPGVADVAHGPVRRVADRRWRVRDLLRVHRRGEQSVGPRACTTARPRSSLRRPPKRGIT